MSNLTLEAIELTRLFGGREAVKNVSFQLEKGEVLGFLGPNGAGKSTTMRMLTGNLAPSIGTVKICGIDMIENPKEAKALIGYLPEMRPIYKELTVDEFLTTAARLHKVPSKQIKKAVEIAKQKCGLSHMSKRLIENLSNGYQQRVAIAQAIIHNPLVVILDEPTVGLDPIQIREIRSLIREIGQKHSVILSTHIQGNLVFHGSIDELKQHRQGNKLMVGFAKAPTVSALKDIEGVIKVEKAEDRMYRIHFKNKQSPADAIVRLSVKNRWGLYQIAPDQTSLEDVFVQLTEKKQTN